MDEARRSARVETKFFAALEGMDDELVPRTGDISATGVYFETDKDVGAVGTVQWLRLASSDRARTFAVMANVVRTVTLHDVGGRRAAGVALEFMPESDEAAAALRAFVHYTLSLITEGTLPHIASRLEARAAAPSHDTDAAVVRQLSVRSMTLETNWAVSPGERVRVDIVAPGMTRRLRLDGRATRVEPANAQQGPRFRIDVEVQEESARPLRHYSSMSFAAVRPDAATVDAMVQAMRAEEKAPPSVPVPRPEDEDVADTLDNLLSALIRPAAATDPARAKRKHLSGLLSRIHFPTLCSLFELERLSGELTVRRDEEQVVLYVRDGQIVDVSPVREGSTVKGEIARLLAWQEGAFELAVVPVNRPDRVRTSTTALLLDLARASDEALEAARSSDPRSR